MRTKVILKHAYLLIAMASASSCMAPSKGGGNSTAVQSSGGSASCSGVSVTITPNFTATEPTGWTKSDSSAISFAVSASDACATVLECRSSLKTSINSATYTSCTAGTHTPSPLAGRTNGIKNDNGTYTLQVRAKDASGAIVATGSQDFYVHPDLNGVPTCTPSFTDNQYFTAAAAYLSMTTPFDTNTNLSAPFYNIEFVRPNILNQTQKTELKKYVSLRKSLKANGNNTLMILKQVRNKWSDNPGNPGTGRARYNPGACTMGTPTYNQGGVKNYWDVDDNFTHAMPDQITVSERFWVGFSGVLATNWRSTSYTDNYWYNRVYAMGHRYHAFGNNGSLKSKRAWQEYFGQNPGITSNLNGARFMCEAVVFNSRGKGLCFRSGTLSDPVPLRSVAPLFANREIRDPATTPWLIGTPKRSMSKVKLVNDGSNTYWNAWAAANSGDAQSLVDSESGVEALNP